MKRVFIDNDSKWQRASADSRLDCEFYNELFQIYPDVQGFYTEPGNTPAECVLKEQIRGSDNLTEVEKTYSGMGTPPPKGMGGGFRPEKLGDSTRILNF